MPGDPISIPPEVLDQVYRAARKAFPAECCGWLTGGEPGRVVDRVRPCTNAQSGGEHPTASERTAESAYVIAGRDLLDFSRSFESPSPARIIYHSHPNGRAYFSETDREVATSPWGNGPTYPVQQLVIGVDSERVTEAALFDWSDSDGAFIEIARFPGSDL